MGYHDEHLAKLKREQESLELTSRTQELQLREEVESMKGQISEKLSQFCVELESKYANNKKLQKAPSKDNFIQQFDALED